MESLFKLFETISPSGYQYKDKKSYHPFWMQEGGSEVTSYNDLTDLPKIGGVEVKGNKSLGTYHLYSKDEVDALFEAVPSGTGLVKTVKEINATMFAAATDNMQLQMLATDRFVHSFTIGNKEYTAGSNLQVMANISGDLAFTYFDSVDNKGYLVILSSAAVEGEITAIHCEMYKNMYHASNLATEPKIYLDDSCTFHKIELALTSSILYPDGTEEALSVPITVRKILITNNTNYSVQHILHDTGLANMSLAGYSYGTDEETGSFYFSLSRVDYNNKDDATQDHAYKVTSATMTVVEEW